MEVSKLAHFNATEDGQVVWDTPYTVQRNREFYLKIKNGYITEYCIHHCTFFYYYC